MWRPQDNLGDWFSLSTMWVLSLTAKACKAWSHPVSPRVPHFRQNELEKEIKVHSACL